MRQVTELQDVLYNYQATIKKCLSIHEFPGISAEELAQFQREFRTSAFTCRLPSCPRAIEGFENDQQRLKHEFSHAPPLKCLASGCQYPAFATARALRNHEARCHGSTGDGLRKSIRRDGHIDLSGVKSNRMPRPTSVNRPRNEQAHLQAKFMDYNNGVFSTSTPEQPMLRQGTLLVTPDKHQLNAHLQEQQQLISVHQEVIVDKPSEVHNLQSDTVPVIEASSAGTLTDSPDIPPQVLKQWGNHIPAEIKKWPQLARWIMDGTATAYTT